MNPTQNPLPSSGAQSLYKLELPLSSGCKLDENSNQTLDFRYAKINGYQISEYDLLNANNVIQQLTNLPGYPAGSVSTKSSNILSLYVRPSIYWSL